LVFDIKYDKLRDISIYGISLKIFTNDAFSIKDNEMVVNDEMGPGGMFSESRYLDKLFIINYQHGSTLKEADISYCVTCRLKCKLIICSQKR
jgi:hypothetical protein